MMGYQTSDIKIYKEESFKVAPASPKVKLIKSTSFDLSEEQKSEVIDLLGNGHEPNVKTYGSYDYSGSLGLVLGGDYMPILLEGVVGEATTVEDATADAWASATAYAVGDIVNHSNGTHSLVCYKAGNSDATEPDLTGVSSGAVVNDATVSWFVRPKMFKRSGKLEACLPSFAIERKDIANCSVGTDHYEMFAGVIMSNLEFKKEGGEIKFDISESVNALDSDNSFKNASYTPFGVGTELEQNFFSEDDLTIEYHNGTDWVELTGFDTINLSLQREVEVVETLEGKRPKFKKTTISGNAKGLLSQELYETSFLKQTKQVRFVYAKANGDKCTVAFSAVEFGNSKKEIPVGEDIMIDIELNASGTTAVSSVSYECITSVDL
jgi:hypothetical protein